LDDCLRSSFKSSIGFQFFPNRSFDIFALADRSRFIPHALRLIGNDEGVVCVVPGGGFDRFFAACAEEFKKGEPEMPLLVKLAAEYGIEFQSGPAS
jgi:hypothetical protein